ncbi:hypothetical protein J4464_06185 [Candidatus Woesearchaeota archaeon]|nr:hypothetical protein [Candidatus Woesearchaeota archaeon]
MESVESCCQRFYSKRVETGRIPYDPNVHTAAWLAEHMAVLDMKLPEVILQRKRKPNDYEELQAVLHEHYRSLATTPAQRRSISHLIGIPDYRVVQDEIALFRELPLEERIHTLGSMLHQKALKPVQIYEYVDDVKSYGSRDFGWLREEKVGEKEELLPVFDLPERQALAEELLSISKSKPHPRKLRAQALRASGRYGWTLLFRDHPWLTKVGIATALTAPMVSCYLSSHDDAWHTLVTYIGSLF